MIIKVSIVLNSHNSEVVRIAEDEFLVSLTEKPENNRANLQLIKIISKYFNTSHNNIRIKSGLRSKKKLVEVNL